MNASELQRILAAVHRTVGMGDNTTKVQNTFYGLNHRGFGNNVQSNTDQHGYTFFTRPRLNLSYHNVLGVRKLHPLLDKSELSIPRAIRAYLDPISNKGLIFEEIGSQLGAVVQRGLTTDDSSYHETVNSALVDPNNPFISLLSNTLVSFPGWPDLVGDIFSSEEGMQRERFAMFDGTPNMYSHFTATATFQNIIADPITLLFWGWVQYGLSIRQGTMVPWPSSVINGRIDYTTRIFRLIMDSTRTYVRKIASTIAFPTSVSIGAGFNYNRDKPVSEENRDIAVNFHCLGVEYNDPVLIREFNKLVGMFNPDMRPSQPLNKDALPPPIGAARGTHKLIGKIDAREADSSTIVTPSRSTLYDGTAPLIKIPGEKMKMNYRGYPLIDEQTLELKWWAPTEDFDDTTYNL